MTVQRLRNIFNCHLHAKENLLDNFGCNHWCISAPNLAEIRSKNLSTFYSHLISKEKKNISRCLEKRRLRGDLIAVYNWKDVEVKWVSVPSPKSQVAWWEVAPDVYFRFRKICLVIKPWNRMFREVVEAPPLEAFQKHGYGTWGRFSYEHGGGAMLMVGYDDL